MPRSAGFSYGIIALLFGMLLACAGCNYTASCSYCEGCVTISSKLSANDSLVYEQTFCSTRYSGMTFQDSVQKAFDAQQAPAMTVSRHDTVFNCQYESPKAKEAGDYEAAGWNCQYPK